MLLLLVVVLWRFVAAVQVLFGGTFRGICRDQLGSQSSGEGSGLSVVGGCAMVPLTPCLWREEGHVRKEGGGREGQLGTSLYVSVNVLPRWCWCTEQEVRHARSIMVTIPSSSIWSFLCVVSHPFLCV